MRNNFLIFLFIRKKQEKELQSQKSLECMFNCTLAGVQYFQHATLIATVEGFILAHVEKH
jgi:hypothetical protein